VRFFGFLRARLGVVLAIWIVGFAIRDYSAFVVTPTIEHPRDLLRLASMSDAKLFHELQPELASIVDKIALLPRRGNVLVPPLFPETNEYFTRRHWATIVMRYFVRDRWVLSFSEMLYFNQEDQFRRRVLAGAARWEDAPFIRSRGIAYVLKLGPTGRTRMVDASGPTDLSW
jgi:hypothetical protein